MLTLATDWRVSTILDHHTGLYWLHVYRFKEDGSTEKHPLFHGLRFTDYRMGDALLLCFGLLHGFNG